MSQRSPVKTHSTISPFPTLPSASHEPIPDEVQQHLAARHKRRLSLRPHRLSVSSARSKTSDVPPVKSRSRRRKGLDLDVDEVTPDPDCVIRTETASALDVHVADRRQSLDDESRDIYEWAILYENQRGITVFSIPYYSKLSLLPTDPPPYTVPNEPTGHGRGNTSQRQTLRAPAALADYQLPDPTWRWVSKFWMVDMRGDGEVQQDGYEYNWCFRSQGWRSSIGSFNAGGWVRRRRWVRLMMRPATTGPLPASSASDSTSTSPLPSLITQTLSSATTDSSVKTDHEGTHIWRGDDEDWVRVRDALREFRSDGRRLEAWERWLGLEERALLAHAAGRLGIGMGNGAKMRMDDWDLRHALDPASPVSKDTTPGTALTRAPAPSKEIMLPVLRENFRRILGAFVFPDSRAQFVELVRLAGYDENSIPDLSKFDSRSDFWSLTRAASPQPSPKSAPSPPDHSSH